MSNKAAILAILSVGSLIAEQAPAKVDFGRDIQPLLREHCVECHGPSQQMRGLRLDRRRDALPNRVGANGSRIVPGDSARSVLFQRLTGTQAGPQMPPTGPLPEQKIKLIQAWIDQGAVWPDELSGDRSATPPDLTVEKMRTALREGKPAEFQRLVNASPKSVNAKGQDGWTPLMYAALYGNVESIRLLLDRDALVNATNDAGGTALMYAVDDRCENPTPAGAGRRPQPALRRRPHRAAHRRIELRLLSHRETPPGRETPTPRSCFPMAPAHGRWRVPRWIRPWSGFCWTAASAAGSRSPMRSPSVAPNASTLLLPHAQPPDLNAALRVATLLGDLPRIDLLLKRGARAGAAPAAGRGALSHSDSRRYHPDFSEPRRRSEHQDILRTDHSRLRQTSGQ